MDIRRKTIRADIERLQRKLGAFSFFNSRFEVPYRGWVISDKPEYFQEFYLMLKNDAEFSPLIRAVNRHGSEKLTTMTVSLYAKENTNDILKKELAKFVDLVVMSASGKKNVDKDYVGAKMGGVSGSGGSGSKGSR